MPFKAHVGADAETALVEEIAVTPANVNDGKAGPAALPDNPGEVFADSAYRGRTFGEAVRARGFVPRIVATEMWGPRRSGTAGAPARLGTSPSIRSGGELRKSSEHGSAAMA
jgi:IS5 family transposase